MRVKTKWIWNLWEGILIVVPLVLLFVNWKWGLIAAAAALILFLIWSLVVLFIGLNTRVNFGAAKVIHYSDVVKLSNKDKANLNWMEKAGEAMEQVTPDGLVLEGKLIRHPRSRGLVYIAHGFGDYRYTSIQNPAKNFYDLGYSIFVGHSRGFSKRSGFWTGMGVLERADHERWLTRLEKELPNQAIFLYGVSMGAASMMNLADLEGHPQICGIIEDCGYVSLYDQMDHSLKNVLQLPEWPILPMTNFWCRRICRYSLKDLDVREKLAASNFPILAVHGRKDDFVPYKNLDLVIEAAGDNLFDAHSYENAAHCQSFVVDSPDYWKRVSRFLDTFTDPKVPHARTVSRKRQEHRQMHAEAKPDQPED